MNRSRIIASVWALTLWLASYPGWGRPGQGSSGAFHPDLRNAIEKLEQTPPGSPAIYTQLRSIWQTWDRADAGQVEGALRAVADDARLGSPERSYAQLLAAYARLRRGDLTTARRQIRALGFVDRWVVLGPFDNEGKAGFTAALLPEAEASNPVTLGRSYAGRGDKFVAWRPPGLLGSHGFLDFGELFRPEQWHCGFAASFIEDPSLARGQRVISAWVGASGAFKLYWNGVERLTDAAYRAHDADRLAVNLSLHAGQNVLLVKLCGTETAPVVSLRLARADGTPDDTLVFSAEPRGKPRLERTERAVAQQAEGPLQRFNKLFDKRPDDAGLSEDFARYLLLTGGDDPAEHRARDLARAAAEREPTVDRLVLAATLAEPSQQALWLKRASELPTTDRNARIAVELALGEVAESGLTWQRAVGHYDAVLALDPDDVRAIQGKAASLSEVGLPRTALAMLERAVERQPSSLTLLNLLASQLRHLGYKTEAREIARRYSAYRFDDRRYWAELLELALVRRNAAEATRLVERLLELEGDGVWVRGLAGRAYRRLNQPELALASLEQAFNVAPDDLDNLRALADLHAELGDRTKQQEMIRRILELSPQDKEARDYLEHIEPETERFDEQYARTPEQFLAGRFAPGDALSLRSLVDLSVRTVYDNGLSSVFRQVVFQPLTDSAATLAREYGFQYEASTQRVQLRGARVFHGDGSVDQVVKTSEAPADNPALAMYTSFRNVFVEFPRIERGDVVELRYRIDDVAPRNEFADYFGEIVYLGSSAPLSDGEYVLVTPRSRTFHFDVQHLPTLKRETVDLGERRVYRFSVDHLAPIEPEPAMPPWPEVLGYVHVSTYGSYRELGDWYWGLVRDQLALDDETRKLAQQISVGLATDLDKVKAVYRWVTKNTRYVALEFGIYGYKPRKSVESMARGWGDCKDKAAMIVSLLDALGIEAHLAIVRTQLRGEFDSPLASFAPFDHAVAYVPAFDLYLDGTAELTGTSELPAADAEAFAVLVKPNAAEMVRLPAIDFAHTSRSRRVDARLHADGSADLEIVLGAAGSQAPDWRRRYHAQATLRERLSEDLTRQFSGFALSAKQEIHANGLDELEGPVRLEATGHVPALGRQVADGISLATTVGIRLTSAYASLPHRQLDVRLPAIGTVDDEFTIELPPGFAVTTPLLPSSVESPFGSFAVEFVELAQRVIIRSRLTIKVSRVRVEDYAVWQKFCEAADRAFEQRLVVGRATPP